MLDNLQAFWADVRDMEKEIAVTISKSRNQQRDGVVYIVSKRNRDKNRDARAGQISLATIRLAATRIIEGFHELATDDQISQYEKDMEARKDLAQAAFARLKGVVVFPTVPPVNQGGK